MRMLEDAGYGLNNFEYPTMTISEIQPSNRFEPEASDADAASANVLYLALASSKCTPRGVTSIAAIG
jgi:hypothetical protein